MKRALQASTTKIAATIVATIPINKLSSSTAFVGAVVVLDAGLLVVLFTPMVGVGTSPLSAINKTSV